MPRPTLALVYLAWAPLVLPAQEPKKDDLSKKPQWQRVLKGDDAKKSANLDRKLEAALDAGRRDEAVKLAEEVLALRSRVQGDDHWETCEAKFTVADLKRALTPVQSRQVEEANRLNEKVVALHGQGKFAEAAAVAERVVAIRKEVLGEDHPATAQSLHNLAMMLKAQAKFAEAEPLYQAAVRAYRAALGETHPATATSLDNLAELFRTQARYADAEPLFRAALRVRKDALGETHPDTATSLNNLAALYDSQARYADAEPLYRHALRIHKEALGDRHPDTATSLNNLAEVCVSLGRNAEAELLHRAALRIRKDVLGDGHPATAQSLNNLATLYHSQGKYAEAEPLYEAALRVRKASLGDNHPDTATSLNNLASLFDSLGRYADAESFFQEALRIRKGTLGNRHPDTATCLHNLAALYEVQGRYAEAEPLYRDALRINTATLGDQHPATAACLHSLAVLAKAQGKYAEAEPLYRDALRVVRQARGDEHPEAARSLHNLAVLYYSQARYAEAERLFRDVLRVCKAAHGDNYPATATCLKNLATVYQAQGKLAEAEPILREATLSYEAGRLLRTRSVERAVGIAGENPYPLLAAVSARLSKPAAGYAALETDLARGLLDEFAARGNTGLSDAEERSRADLAARVAVIQDRVLRLLTQSKRTDSDQRELVALTAERREKEAAVTTLSTALSRRTVADLAAVQAALDPAAALVAWVDVEAGDRKADHWACVVRRTGDPKWEHLHAAGKDDRWSEEDLNLPVHVRWVLRASSSPDDLAKMAKQLQHHPEAVRTIREAVASPAKAQALFARLHAQRIAPIAKHLDGVKTLYVVSANVMAGIPIEVLTPDYTVGYVPSGTFLARRGKPSANSPSLFALGDPVYEVDKPNRPTDLPKGGLLVQQLDPNGSAAKAGLRPNDVLLKYGDSALNSVDDLKAAMKKAAEAKGEVALTVWRIDDATKAAEFTRKVLPGPLGVVLDRDPAPVAVANRRKSEALTDTLRGSWGDLPGTRYEVSRIARLFDHPNVNLDSDASEQTLDKLRRAGGLSKYRYLHFAVHGQGNSVRAFDSALVLSQDRPAETLSKERAPLLDNRVTAREVLDHWKLDADLVTLSACETAVGLSAGGDGLLGFAQAFLLAGSRSVCLSLWKVDDTATALLMARFYENLLGRRDGIKPMNKVEALKEAKDWLKNLSGPEALRLGADLRHGVVRAERKNTRDVEPLRSDIAKDDKPFAHPKYWAAFILIGDPD